MIPFHKPPFKLREFKIEVTHRCALECIHCSSEAASISNRQLREEDCLRILREAIELGAEEVAFSGGEPLLWHGLGKAVEVAHKGGLRVLIYTSGNVPAFENRITILKSLGVEKCVFSIFGASSYVHEQITGILSSFENTLKAIIFANKAGLHTEIHFVPFADNYKELEAISNLAKNHDVSRISILRFVPHGRGRYLNKQILNSIQNLELKETIRRLRSDGFNIRTGSPYNFLMLNDKPECCAAIDRLVIGPDLRIYPCDAFKQIKAEDLVGSLRLSSLEGQSFKECWKGSPYLELVREYLTTPFAKQCASCGALEKCLSGCLAQKVIAYGNFEKRPDPMCLLQESGVRSKV